MYDIYASVATLVAQYPLEEKIEAVLIGVYKTSP